MFIEPEVAIDSLDVLPGMTAADFGAGAGFYTMALARRLGDSGKVYAIDIRQETLEVVRSKAKAEQFSNVETLWGDLEKPGGSHLQSSSLDIVVVSNILFQAADKTAVAGEAARVLRAGGKVMAVEWLPSAPAGLGPAGEHRLTKTEVEALFRQSGLNFEKEFDAGEHHFGLIFRKP
ncbi:MAG: methyltransferase domain-containing protein [Patescibacteria group bacterium]